MTYDASYVPALPWCAVLATVLLGLITSLSTSTPKGTEWMGRIGGFRDFLCSPSAINWQRWSNRTRNTSTTPALRLGLNVSDKWAKKIETIAIQPPNWYYGHTGMFYPSCFE
jgi:hypothetical protein